MLARGVGLAGAHPLERRRAIGPRHPHVMHFASRTLPWISTTISGDWPGRVVQAVDVLGDERVQRALALELDERVVRGVRLRRPHLAVAAGSATRWRRTSGSRHVVLERRGLLGGRVLRPHAVRPAEVGDPRLGRDPGAGERDHRRRAAQPAGDGFQIRRVRGRSSRLAGEVALVVEERPEVPQRGEGRRRRELGQRRQRQLLRVVVGVGEHVVDLLLQRHERVEVALDLGGRLRRERARAAARGSGRCASTRAGVFTAIPVTSNASTSPFTLAQNSATVAGLDATVVDDRPYPSSPTSGCTRRARSRPTATAIDLHGPHDGARYDAKAPGWGAREAPRPGVPLPVGTGTGREGPTPPRGETAARGGRCRCRARVGGRAPSAPTRARGRGGSRRCAARVRRCRWVSPCATSMSATRRARRRASSSGAAPLPVDPLLVLDLERGGQPAHVAAVHGRERRRTEMVTLVRRCTRARTGGGG